MFLVLLSHFLFTSFMTGIIWFCQIVHYPLFRNIPTEAFCEYEKKNMVTGYVVVPAMLLELATGLWLLWHSFTFPYILNAALLSIIWLSTALLQGPMHNRLAKDPSHSIMNRLIRSNWIRTGAWTLRVGLLLFLLVNILAV